MFILVILYIWEYLHVFTKLLIMGTRVAKDFQFLLSGSRKKLKMHILTSDIIFTFLNYMYNFKNGSFVICMQLKIVPLPLDWPMGGIAILSGPSVIDLLSNQLFAYCTFFNL